MRIQEAREFGNELARLVAAGQAEAAYARLAPLLAERTPFRILDQIGEESGAPGPQALDPFLERIAAGRTMGGWVVAGAALGRRIDNDLDWALGRGRDLIAAADSWYAADSLGERLPGPALVCCFGPALALLGPWREDPNRWVRRAAGVAVHFWAKRARGDPQYAPQAGALLDFLEPLFSEREIEAVKGVGWGLKTLGRYYPDQAAGWLQEQIVRSGRAYRGVTVRKALTYLPEELRKRALGKIP